MYRKEKGHVLVLARKFGEEEVLVTRDEVHNYINDPEFQYFLSVYQYTKLWGLPNGDGWANEPTDILDGITALELEAKTIESEMYNKDKPSGGQLNARSVNV